MFAPSRLSLMRAMVVIGTLCLACMQTALWAQTRGSRSGLVVADRVQPNWSADGNRFWYRRELAEGRSEFILVQVERAARQAAFDHAQVAATLSNSSDPLGLPNAPQIDPERLPIDRLAFANDPNLLVLIGRDRDRRWAWNIAQQKLVSASNVELESSPPQVGLANLSRTGADTEIVFDNRTSKSIELFWISEGRRSYGQVPAGQRHYQHTYGGHRWAVVTEDGEELGEVVANDTPTNIVVDGRQLSDTPSRRSRRSGARSLSGRSASRSPDGKWQASIEDHNVVVRATNSDQLITLSRDGREGQAYTQLNWSPDSQSLIAWRTELAEHQEVHLVRSSPSGGGRAQLESRPYALPGDPFTRHEVNLFRLADQQQVKPAVDRFEHEWESPRVYWSSDGQSARYLQVDRGHQRLRVIEIHTQDGQVRNLIDERSDTFIWTAHSESGLPPVTWLDDSDELIYASERSGWRHLYLVNAQNADQLHPITAGAWVVRGIERIDPHARQVWFRASGCYADQDPYLIHYGRVNFDGSGLVWLTAGNGNHTVQYSPDGRYLIDSYSRVDLPPVNELRKVDDGSLVCPLEQAEITSLEATGWKAPEVFTAKGRDGQTDIWGIICRPKDFDPQRSYPVIEDIYAGPHGAFVPKSFSPTQRYESLNKLGFIVVKMDGMGTAFRSKAFHDVCWQNLKDAGFEDRIAWMKAAAARYKELDISRVGIYGTSAGGQNAAAAVLFHPEFYKVAVASCGCHDNRMDKASWNEQWMGYPVGPHYSQCSNIDNAGRLQGKLLLVVGEMDTNVPPESTMRFVDRLISADKDFELLVVPNAGHGNGGAYGVRRMHEFFVRHLLREP